MAAMINFGQAFRELYAEKPWQVEHDMDWLVDVREELGFSRLKNLSEDDKIVLNGEQLKGLLRLATLGNEAIRDLIQKGV